MTLLQPGQKVGPYEIIEQAGSGGMAVVYRAFHPATHRDVAIKIVPFQFAQDEDFIARFRQEVRVIARLEHPRILPVYDSGTYENMPYLVMRYMPSGTLKELITPGGLTMPITDRIFMQLADALAYAHSQGVIHRDIKPGNVLVTPRNDLFLTDFGIAKLVESTSQFSATGQMTGTPAYMSPEQAHGSQLDQRSDIYSLGIVLYEMLTGRVPFQAETPLAVILKQVQEAPPPLRELNDAIHPAIEQVVMTMLAKERVSRYPDVPAAMNAWQLAYSTSGGTQQNQAAAATTIAPPAGAALPVATAEQPSFRPTETSAAERQRRSRKIILGGIIGGLLLLALFIGLGAVLINSLSDDGSDVAAGTVAATGAPGVLPDPAETSPAAGSVAPGGGGVQPQAPSATPLPTPFAAAAPQDGEWTSWASANVIYDLAIAGDFLYAGGPNGLTVWNTTAGTYERLSVADGLPGPQVNVLEYDAETNVLWVGTDNGLGRYDGISWIYYDEQDGLDSDFIYAILIVEDIVVVGTYYSAPGHGVNVFQNNRWIQPAAFETSDSGAGETYNVSALLALPSGDVLIGTQNGLFIFDGERSVRLTTEDGLPSNVVTALALAAQGNVIIGTENGILFEGGSGTETALATWPVTDIAQTADGSFWISTSGAAWRYNPEFGDLQQFSADDGTIPSYSITSAAAAADGRVFLGTDDSGVLVYDGQFDAFFVPNVPRQSSTANILAQTDGTLLFLEQYSFGRDSFDPATETWRTLPAGDFAPVAVAPDGRLWGINDSGVVITGGSAEVFIGVEQGLPGDTVNDITFTPWGTAVVATSGGIAEIAGDAVVTSLRPVEIGLQSSVVGNVLADDGGQIWLTTEAGFAYGTFDGEWELFLPGDALPDTLQVTTDIVQDSRGDIWIATFGDGVFRFHNDEWQHFSPESNETVTLPASVINTIIEDSAGALWFGTDAGLVHFNGVSWTLFTAADGLVYNDVLAVYESAAGELWIGTGAGISRFTP